MLSIGKLAAGPTAGRYYVEQAAQGREDYYAGEGEAPGTWIGVGATSLALRGEVTEGGIGLLLDARDPGSGAQLRRWRALARGRARDGGHCRGAARRDRALSRREEIVEELERRGEHSARAAPDRDARDAAAQGLQRAGPPAARAVAGAHVAPRRAARRRPGRRDAVGPTAAGAALTIHQILFARIRSRFTGLQPVGRYRVTQPYGVDEFEADRARLPRLRALSRRRVSMVRSGASTSSAARTRLVRKRPAAHRPGQRGHLAAAGPPRTRWAPRGKT